MLSDPRDVSFPLRAEVEGHNNQRLSELKGRVYTYHSIDSRGYNAKGEILDKETAERLLERLVARREISLKVGAFRSQVESLTSNLPGRIASYVNKGTVQFELSYIIL